MQKISKAIIPAAGLGTRFLPATIAQPKEMLIVVDKPVIQYVVEEAVQAGITDILIVTGRGKRAIEDHFDPSEELELTLEKKGKAEFLREIRQISDLANIHFIRQKRQRGLADAIYQGRKFVGDEPFAVLLGDTILDANGYGSCLAEMVEIFGKTAKTVVAVEKLENKKEVERYGIVKIGRKVQMRCWEVEDMVEKPSIDRAPSNLAVASRYVFTPEIFKHIEKTAPGKGGEIQITDSIKKTIGGSGVLAYQIDGKRYDLGNKVDFIKTNVDFALRREGIKEEVMAHIKSLVKERK